MNRCMTLVLSAFAFAGLVQAQSVQRAADMKQQMQTLSSATVTVLVDNMAGGDLALGEWGLAFLINTDRDQILLDTGGGKTLLGNCRALDVDLAKTQAIVISHGHGDHTDGLDSALNVCKSPNLFVHPTAFEKKYYRGPSGINFFTFPLTREQLSHRTRKLVETKEPTIICGGVMVTGQIPRVNDFEDTGLRGILFLDSSLTTEDPILDDQAIFFRVPEGIVILLGCGHSGLVNTMEYVGKLTGEQHIYAIIGGTHMLSASEPRLQKTVEALKKYDVQKIMLSHCTGIRSFAKLANALPNKCSWPACETVIKFGKR
jgi:7,8-dihydropterin-6-yl-methyl-4-(beta-D-ribofuranosyl)aminobenzene 5'-phosphate synthase